MLANQIAQARAIIQQGGVIAYSTDTILGLGCDPTITSAVDRILWLKQRSIEKGLILLVSDIGQLENFSQPLSSAQIKKLSSTHTPTTWLLPKHAKAPSWIVGKHINVAIRLVEHSIAAEICHTSGAIVSSSANFSNYPNAENATQLRNWFGPYLDYVIIGETGTGIPSEIRDLINDERLRTSSKK